MKTSYNLVTTVLLCSLVTTLFSQENALTDLEKMQGWTLLFDGESTDAWRGYGSKEFPVKGWQVNNGVLKVVNSGTGEEGYGGDIITKEQYEDFEFKVDFLLTDTANSGILYLVKEFQGEPIWHNAPEYQLLDDLTYFEMLGEWMDTHRTGDNYDLYAADEYYANPVGEWNTAMITKQGNRVEHWLNGKLTISYEIGSVDWMHRVEKSKFNEFPMYCQAKQGHIGLQDHGHEVHFKNIKVRRL